MAFGLVQLHLSLRNALARAVVEAYEVNTGRGVRYVHVHPVVQAVDGEGALVDEAALGVVDPQVAGHVAVGVVEAHLEDAAVGVGVDEQQLAHRVGNGEVGTAGRATDRVGGLHGIHTQLVDVHHLVRGCHPALKQSIVVPGIGHVAGI